MRRHTLGMACHATRGPCGLLKGALEGSLKGVPYISICIYIYIYLYKHGQGLGPSGGLLGRFPGHCMHFCHFEGQIIDKFEIGFFPIPWMGHLELHFRLFEVSRP